MYLYNEQISNYGMTIKNNWKGDPRERFIGIFKPLLDGTEYFFKVNTTDSSGKILEVYVQNNPKRIMGISGRSDMDVNIFFNPDLYKTISARIDLPGNQKAYRSQPHMVLSLETVWNVLCVLTRKENLRTDI